MAPPIRLRYVTLDVFTTKRYAGNPLAIVKVPSNQPLTQEQKQLIAREFNFSETVILHETDDPVYEYEHKIDIFMTNAEIQFAGHPTIGAACFLSELQSSKNGDSSPSCALVTKAGKIPYRYDTELKAAVLDIPHDVHIHKLQVLPEDAGKAGISAAVVPSISVPIQIVSIVKGMTFAMVELPSKEALSQASGSLNVDQLNGTLDSTWFAGGVLGTYYFVDHGRAENGSVMVSSRMITNNGMLEDPATGSATSACSAFLAMREMEKEDGKEDFEVEFEVEQGADMGRPSKIQTKVVLDRESGAVRKITLGGSAVQVMEGNLVV